MMGGWYGGEYDEARPYCEDAPCCGCCGPQGDDQPEDAESVYEVMFEAEGPLED
jgi:hypothetical protein